DPAKVKEMPPKLVAKLAECYSTLENHKKAAELYGSIPEPKKDAPDADRDLYQGIRLRYVKELRLDKQGDAYRKELGDILGTKDKPGWGAKNLNAVMESYYLEMEDGKWNEAVHHWDTLINKTLLPKFTNPSTKDQYKEPYFESYLALVVSQLKNGQKEMD